MSDYERDCGCDASDEPTVVNAPGKRALDYRIGVFGSFKRRMMSRLALPDSVPDLATPAADDPIRALVDAWAVPLDILTFYQERIANEGYLRTAVEDRSAQELGRAIGYQPRAGLAAETHLAFIVDEAPGTPHTVRLDINTKVQSIPGQDELPQTYETVEPIVAESRFNAVPLQSFARRAPVVGETFLRLKGAVSTIAAGDRILLISQQKKTTASSGNWCDRKVVSVVPDPTSNTTIVNLATGIAGVYTADAEVWVVRTRAAIFGASAPDIRLLTADIRTTFGGSATATEYSNFNIAYSSSVPANHSTLYLDTTYPALRTGQWALLDADGSVETYQITATAETKGLAFTLAGRSTRLSLAVANSSLGNTFGSKVRETAVFVATDVFALGEYPIAGSVTGNQLTLAVDLDPLPDTPRLISIEDSDSAEIANVLSAATVGGLTQLTLERNLEFTYTRAETIVNLNVAHATHGETRREVLGSGRAAVPFQRFVLKQNPLTYVSAANASGLASTLEVRVNDILWTEIDTLFFAGPTDRVYETRINGDGKTEVRFGDGLRGARLPTGLENVMAKYRVGSGTAGLVRAEQLTLLMTRPLGLKGATNPVAPNGAADPETLDDIRENAPSAFLTFGRIVSLQDYEDFARGIAGIAKAKAQWLWDGERRTVVLTVAGTDGEPVLEGTDLYDNLRSAIDDARHVRERVAILTYDPVYFIYGLKVKSDPLYIGEDVREAVRTALAERFAFANQELAGSVTFSEIARIGHSVEGVIGLDIDYLVSEEEFWATDGILNARPARWDEYTHEILPAQLFTVYPFFDLIQITEMQA